MEIMNFSLRKLPITDALANFFLARSIVVSCINNMNNELIDLNIILLNLNVCKAIFEGTL